MFGEIQGAMSVDNYGHRYLSDQDGETEDINGYMDSRPGSSILLQEHRLSDLIPECYAATSDKQDAGKSIEVRMCTRVHFRVTKRCVRHRAKC